MRLLYVIGEESPTSVPLEVAHFMGHDALQLRVVAFTRSKYRDEALEAPLVCIGARHRLDWHAVLRLYRCIVQFQPDVIHVHHTMSAFWTSLFGGLHGAKIVRSEHSSAMFRTAGQRAINTVSQALADLVLCNSQNTYRSLPEWKERLLGGRWKVVYNGVDLDRIKHASARRPSFNGVKGRCVTIGSVGRLIDVKNHERLLQAFSKVVSACRREVQLVIIGDGENRSQLERTIDRLDLGRHVILAGEVDRDDVYAALHRFDLFVMPSLWEGFCNAVVEAMAAGLPVVCSDISTLREVVGDVALYADPEEPEDMARVLIKSMEMDATARKRWGEKAQKRAAERYTIERTAEKYIEAYLSVAEKGSP